MNYYRRYVGDYLRDTADLSLAEHGAYCLLLDYYYADEAPLPGSVAVLYRRLRAMSNEERRAIDAVLQRFFTLEPDGFHQKRVDHEIGVSQTARSNGKGGGRPSGGSKTGNLTGIETGSQTEEETEQQTGRETGLQTGTQTGEATGSVHPPTTNLQPLSASLQPPASSPPTEVVSTVSGRGKSVARGSRLAPDWEMPQGWVGWAMGEQPTWTIDYAFRVARIFKDHWIAQPGQKGVKLDWEATWRNWVRKEGPMRANGSGKSSLSERNRAAVEAAKRELFGPGEKDITHEAKRV